MSDIVYKDAMRVTSIPFTSSKLVIFSGVPLKNRSYRISSGKYSISIKVNPEDLPIPPAIGQHWTIEGRRSVEDRAGPGNLNSAISGISA
jgi:exodeoxyribonuclease V alpha subunit